jgi:hypothetical protein
MESHMENPQVVPAQYCWKRGFRNPPRENLRRFLKFFYAPNHVKKFYSMVLFKYFELQFGSHVVFQAILIDPAHSNFIGCTL